MTILRISRYVCYEFIHSGVETAEMTPHEACEDGIDCPPHMTCYYYKELRLRALGWWPITVILLDWTGVDLTPKSTPYAKEAVELQDSNMAPDQIYTINSKSWQKVRKKVRREERTRLTLNHKASI